MAVSYKKLFKLLIDRDMKKKDFVEIIPDKCPVGGTSEKAEAK